ncbi:hypothetical protein EDD76_11015 [Kineothrix alysoides]|uniref:Membrane protein YczE n=1 Tax=Kineothrix alysoides TaxID=1469948 RepID=A0A4R1QUI5_9FIRM|nr:hypothetical protein [Kineothrix alysoides]TCL56843.1 hypothetical protein EDD76_11015 [Kineothrix alysoides]
MSIKIKKISVSLIMFILFGFGISLQIKSNIGQSMLNALALTLTDVSAAKIGTFVIGLFLSSTTLGILLAIGIINFPLEGFCITLSNLFHTKLTTVRFSLDAFFFGIILILVVFTHVPFYIREGTIISFILLSYLLGQSYKYAQKLSISQ